jgi:D-inositol-3-phosphate glycosyltransferase
MHLHVLSHHAATASLEGLTQALGELGHRVTHSPLPDDSPAEAAALGHQVRAGWVTDRPDAVVALGWLAGLAAQVGSRGLSLPVVQRLYSPGRSADVDRRRLESAIARGADRVLSLCSSDTEALVNLGVRRPSVRVVPHGVDIGTFGDEGPTWPATDVRRLVGRPAGHTAAARLIGLLPGLPSSELVLLTGPGTRAEATSALTSAIERHPVESRVRLMDLEREDGGLGAVAALLRSTELAVVVDDEEPSLDLVLQAMATGVPVVAPAAGALVDVVVDGVTGVLVPPNAAGALGDAVRSLLGDALSRESQGLAAGDRARASFGWPGVAAAIVRVVEELVPQPVPAHRADPDGAGGTDGTGGAEGADGAERADHADGSDVTDIRRTASTGS